LRGTREDRETSVININMCFICGLIPGKVFMKYTIRWVF